MVAFINQPITNQKDLDNEGKITMGRRRKKSREQSAGTYVLTRRERSAGGVSRIVESSAEFYNFYVDDLKGGGPVSHFYVDDLKGGGPVSRTPIVIS